MTQQMCDCVRRDLGPHLSNPHTSPGRIVSIHIYWHMLCKHMSVYTWLYVLIQLQTHKFRCISIHKPYTSCVHVHACDCTRNYTYVCTPYTRLYAFLLPHASCQVRYNHSWTAVLDWMICHVIWYPSHPVFVHAIQVEWHPLALEHMAQVVAKSKVLLLKNWWVPFLHHSYPYRGNGWTLAVSNNPWSHILANGTQ